MSNTGVLRQGKARQEIILLIALSTGIAADRDARAGSGQLEPPPDGIALSVSNNHDDSSLTAGRVLEVVNHPDSDPQLYALLGQPLTERRTFYLDVHHDFWIDDYLRMVEVSKHYTTLKYRDGADLAATERRLREEQRFAYSGIDWPESFSATPSDAFFAYTGGLPPINYNLDNYQWGSQSWITGLTSA